MSKSALLIDLLLLRVAGTALLVVLASLHPIALQIITILGLMSLLVYILSWVLDDWLIAKFNLSQGDYYARLIAYGSAAVVGIGTGLWIIL